MNNLKTKFKNTFAGMANYVLFFNSSKPNSYIIKINVPGATLQMRYDTIHCDGGYGSERVYLWSPYDYDLLYHFLFENYNQEIHIQEILIQDYDLYYYPINGKEPIGIKRIQTLDTLLTKIDNILKVQLLSNL